MKTIGIGVIGCDDMGRNLATSAHAVEGLEVICVSDVQEAFAEKLAVDLNVFYTSDYHELLADDRVHAVLIATSPLMEKIAADSAEAGKYNFYRMDRNIPLEEVQHMLIEHLLPPAAFYSEIYNKEALNS
jgi:predicted dehydrogenase